MRYFYSSMKQEPDGTIKVYPDPRIKKIIKYLWIPVAAIGVLLSYLFITKTAEWWRYFIIPISAVFIFLAARLPSHNDRFTFNDDGSEFRMTTGLDGWIDYDGWHVPVRHILLIRDTWSFSDNDPCFELQTSPFAGTERIVNGQRIPLYNSENIPAFITVDVRLHLHDDDWNKLLNAISDASGVSIIHGYGS